jgi:GntR family transcriptional regulator
MLSIDLQSRVPIFEQIQNGIIRLVHYGVLVPDEQLPSVRNLAQELGVNPNTVQKAYQQLEGSGMIYSVAGRGSFISELQSNSDYRHNEIADKLLILLQEAVMKGFPRERLEKMINQAYDNERSQL